MADVNDMDLVREYCARQSESAFQTLVQRYVNLVYSVALRRVGNPAQAEEISQAVFIILARKAANLRPNTVLPAWLHETTRHVAASFLRGEMRRRRREQEAYMQSTVQTPDDDAVWEQMAPLLDEAIGRLRSDDREMVVLRYFQDQSAREIAAGLNIGEAAAQKRLTRAVEKLRLDFFKRGVNVSSGVFSGAVLTHSIQAAPAHVASSVLSAASGTAASTSTLILAKGALKIMAWTKAKTAMTGAVVILLGIGVTLFTVKMVAESRVARLNALHDIQGTWEGDLSVGGAGVNRGQPYRERMVLKISNQNGNYAAVADLIDFGHRNVPVGIVYAYPSVTLSINPQITLSGTASEDGKQLNFGNIALNRTEAPDAMPDEMTEAAFAPRAGSDLQGYWKGSVDAKPSPLPLDWKIAERADGTFRAELDNPNQGVIGQPATVIYQRPNVQLILTCRNGMLQGELNYDHTEIKGAWMMPGRSVPVTFKRADYREEHAQDSAREYSFHSDRDLQGHWETSYLLRKKPKFPVVLDLDIAKMPDGNYSATVASIYHLGHDAPRPASEFQYAAPNLHIAWKWMDDRFEGKLKDGKIIGDWISGNRRQPVVFERRTK